MYGPHAGGGESMALGAQNKHQEREFPRILVRRDREGLVKLFSAMPNDGLGDFLHWSSSLGENETSVQLAMREWTRRCLLFLSEPSLDEKVAA